MTIGQLSKFTDLSIHTIRYYESIKLIPKPKRTPKGYRIYDGEFIFKMKIIKKFQELGFTLNEIREISNFDDCKELKEIAFLKLRETRDKIKNYRKLERELKKFLRSCPISGAIEGCPLIKMLNKKLTELQHNNIYRLVSNA